MIWNPPILHQLSDHNGLSTTRTNLFSDFMLVRNVFFKSSVRRAVHQGQWKPP
jgi:hypothetical protein